MMLKEIQSVILISIQFLKEEFDIEKESMQIIVSVYRTSKKFL